MLGRWEWIIIALVLLGFLLVELRSVRRAIRADKARAAEESGSA